MDGEPEAAPDEAQYLTLTFTAGDITAIDGVSMTPAEVVAHLNEVAADTALDESISWKIAMLE